MKIVLQRVSSASVEIDSRCVGKIGKGYLLLVGFEREDHGGLIAPMVDKLLKIKLFSDDQGRFADNLEEVGGALLVISQFTLFADLKKGKKPSLSRALPPDEAKDLYHAFLDELHRRGAEPETGVFGEYMQVYIQNDGPVTMILDSKELFSSFH